MPALPAGSSSSGRAMAVSATMASGFGTLQPAADAASAVFQTVDVGRRKIPPAPHPTVPRPPPARHLRPRRPVGPATLSSSVPGAPASLWRDPRCSAQTRLSTRPNTRPRKWTPALRYAIPQHCHLRHAAGRLARATTQRRCKRQFCKTPNSRTSSPPCSLRTTLISVALLRFVPFTSGCENRRAPDRESTR